MKFSDFGFKKFINDGLEQKGFDKPTTIQAEVIPYFKKHQNVVAKAHTGTGKTYAFLLPILNNLNYSNHDDVQALIIAPTRELAKQIYSETQYFKQFNPDLTIGLYIGGEDTEKQKQGLENKQPMIAIGTPQKVKELYDENLLRVTTASWVVVDEFDMIFDLGFFDDLDYLMARIRKDSVKSLFSATMNPQLIPFVKKYINNPVFIDQVENNTEKENIKNIMIDAKNRDDKLVLQTLVKQINPYIAIVFVNNKDEVSEVVNWLREVGIQNIGEMHGDLQPRTRASMLKKIKNNEFKYIVATDIAARGIDIEGVSHVISIDLPKDLSYYIHRAGRTGRGKLTGESYVIFNAKNQEKIQFLKQKGINFEMMRLIDGKIVPEKTKVAKKKKPGQISAEEQLVLSKYKDNKGKNVKPGYKKKRKYEMEKIKKQKRRQHIKENIEKIKKNKYRKRAQEVFGKDIED
ncbi:DEAD/DEAH box helicase [Mesoplasma lactucae]|uniref:Helicase n=1 Tax=Mesoplasma lactucae ATCC 49193 TaxID=81460 RepID=A0A291IRJ8_9MOLU|nr:DEAD/DEAH box helicase [Mesoplasma lactucae]ATG97358.1 helicase [Mesoplasma lactucae ATCC 49193]ATZ20190.1 ATP-dependent RNA helicase [Mesoplasma lactucae ATCC 49193]MCL8216939.1 DEAD-box ATP-dependent RNA helicase CshB [Mesoplasma lactucae ATCC 49193]